ncbi:MAG: hypothetical protein MUO73_05230 [Thermoplasmata archaeon]|nr:hypothetical protein [Thermoplasmata archaeon]
MDMGLSPEQIKELGTINERLLKSLQDAETRWNPIVIYTAKLHRKHIFYLVDPVWGHIKLRSDTAW